MLSTILGTAAFLLYLIYDINSFLWNRRLPRSFFLIGTLMLAAATVIDLIDALHRNAFSGILDWIFLFPAALSFLALVYCLFFAIPFDETYTEQISGRPVCDRGAYALCRHPGILCFFLFYLFLGIAAFLLYLVYDINSYTRQLRFVHSFFLLGTVLLCGATAWDIWCAWKAGCFAGAGDVLLLVGAAVFFALLIYSLFFALPFEKTYTEQSSGNHVYSGGVYALCRHPGILCFFGMYLLLGLAALPYDMLLRGMIFSGLNLIYGYFQDRVTFPKTFCDYTDYQKKVPFLIPTKASIRMAWKTLQPAENEEDDL